MNERFTGSQGTQTITLYDDNHLQIKTDVPKRFALQRSNDWENDAKTKLTLTLQNSTPFTITVSSITLQLALYEPHSPSANNNYQESNNFNTQWDDDNNAVLSLSNTISLAPNEQKTLPAGTMDFFANSQISNANADCFLQATVSYKVSGGVSSQVGTPTNPPVAGTLGTWVSI